MPFCARLPLLDTSVDRVQRLMGSAALVLGSIFIAASICFASIWIALVRICVTWGEQPGS